MPRISIVIPARNEADNIADLVRGIAAACAGDDIEILVVDDASTDATPQVLRALTAEVTVLRMLRHEVAGGQSAAIHSGILAARGSIVATLDGDGQNPPEELPRLYGPFLSDPPARLGLVAGQRVKRQDTWSKRWASKLANGLRGRLLGDGTRDTGCGLKAFRREGFLALPYFNHMHRYLPALFVRDGWEILHVDVSHRARGGGRSNYNNLQRAMVGVVDLAGVLWLMRRRKTAVPAEVTEIASGAAADTPAETEAREQA